MIVRLSRSPFEAPSLTSESLAAYGITIERVRRSQAEIARGEYLTLDEFTAAALHESRAVRFDELPDAVQRDIAENLISRVSVLGDWSPEDLRKLLVDSVPPPPSVKLSATAPAALRRQFKNRRTSAAQVHNLKAKLTGNIELDPVVVSGGTFIDGGHRVQAYVDAGRKTIPTVDIAPLLALDWERWLAGENEDVLEETVQQVRTYLNGKYQVLDLGTIGLFRVYSVRAVSDEAVNTFLQYVVPAKDGAPGPRAVDAWLKQVHPIAEYRRAVAKDAGNAPYALDPTIANYDAISANIQRASDAITGLGVPRQRDTLILLDLTTEKNRITGSGVGGRAYRYTHAIEVDLAEMTKPYGIELLVHEWGHKQFFGLPQHVTQYVRDWFEINIVKEPRISAEKERLTQRDRQFAIDRAWGAFRQSWGKWSGVYPDHYLETKARVQKGDTHDKREMLFDMFLKRGMTGEGTVKKGIRNPEGGPGIHKGTPVMFLRASAFGPDTFVVHALGKNSAGAFQVPEAVVRASIVIDVEKSAERNTLDMSRLEFLLYKWQTPDAEDEDRFFTRENFIYSEIDEAIAGAVAFLNQRYVRVHGADFFPVSKRGEWADEWIAQAQSDGDKFDPEATFRRLFEKYAVWDAIRARSIEEPSGEAMRDMAKQLGITPSSYAAANVDELWAELIAHSAVRPHEVPKALRELLRDAIQRKTPRGGQRVWHDRTPQKYRKIVGESALVVLRGDPFQRTG